MYFILLALPLSVMSAQSDTTAQARINAFAKNLKAFDKFYTQEKVYLHLDNNGYLPGENIWFKAYVFRASTLLPTDVSKVLYVELLSPHGQVVDCKTLPILNGRTYGDFKLDKNSCHSGFYQVRAYTRAMLNWDDAFIFSRVFPVYEEPTDTINFTDTKVAETVYNYRKKNDQIRTAPEPLLAPGTQEKGNVMLSFFPEGGYSTLGLESTVAYKLTDVYGLPLHDSIMVYDGNGKVLAASHTSHDGMGSFCLAQTPEQAYAVVTVDKKDLRFDLPQPRATGADLHVTQNPDSSVTVAVRASDALQHDTLGISVMCRSQLGFFQSLVPATDGSITIAAKDLRDGVNQITLFTPMGEILSERLVWKDPQGTAPKMQIAQNQDTYGPYSPVVLGISLTDSDDKPLQGDFSISVRDANTETAPDYHSLQTEMLLASELKGYIRNPEYYFDDNKKCRQDLDLLLMVQGWRRYSWKQMAGVERLVVTQPIEDGLLLFGNVTETNAAQNALEKYGSLSVNFLLNTSIGSKAFSVNTDKKGNYAVALPKFYGDAPSIITVTDKKDKRVYTNLRIQRNFSPAVKPYEPIAVTKPKPVEQIRANAISKPSVTFEWQDTIPDVVGKLVKIGGVEIKARKSIFGYDPIGVKRGSGENVAKQGASFIYDIPRELDKYLDQGNAIPNLWQWLATVNPSFEYYPTDDEKYYNGRLMEVQKDIDKTQEGRIRIVDSSYPMNQYRSLVIVENIDAANKISRSVTGTQVDENGEFSEFSSSSTNAIAYVFSLADEKETEYYKRGTRWATIHGYSQCDEFFSPDYRLKDIPTPADHRRTLYWNPSLTTDKDGKADVIFYSNSRGEQRLHIIAEGIGINGQMFEYR